MTEPLTTMVVNVVNVRQQSHGGIAGMVAQWLGQLPHNKKAQGLNPPSG